MSLASSSPFVAVAFPSMRLNEHARCDHAPWAQSYAPQISLRGKSSSGKAWFLGGRDVPNIGRGLSENRIPTNSTYIILMLYPHSPLPITLWHGYFWGYTGIPHFHSSPKKAMIRFCMLMGWSLAKRRLCDWRRGWSERYPLVNIQNTTERSTIFNGKTHYFYGHYQ